MIALSNIYLMAALVFAIAALFKNKYSTYLGAISMLIISINAIEKTSPTMVCIFLLSFFIFEIICFTQESWSFHRFNVVKKTKKKILWPCLCTTIGISLVVSLAPSSAGFTLSKLTLERDLMKILIPIILCLFGLIKIKSGKSTND